MQKTIKLLTDLVLAFLLIIVWMPSAKAIAKENKALRTWHGSGFILTEINDKILEILGPDERLVKLTFELNIEDIYPNSSMPLALVSTYDEEGVKASMDDGAVMPIAYWNCKSYIVDLSTGKKYEYEKSCSQAITNIWSPDGIYAVNGFSATIMKSKNIIDYLKGKSVSKIQIQWPNHHCNGIIDHNSWQWINEDVLAFSGGACGTNLDYLYHIKSEKLESYCGKFQKSRYGCPETFLSAKEFSNTIKKLIEFTEQDH